jgi:hypothetical protein
MAAPHAAKPTLNLSRTLGCDGGSGDCDGGIDVGDKDNGDDDEARS